MSKDVRKIKKSTLLNNYTYFNGIYEGSTIYYKTNEPTFWKNCTLVFKTNI